MGRGPGSVAESNRQKRSAACVTVFSGSWELAWSEPVRWRVLHGQTAKPKFLPSPEMAGAAPVVEAAKGPGVSVPVDPILAAKLEASSAALANAHKPEEIVRCSLEEVAVLGQVAANLGKDERAADYSPDRGLPTAQALLV